MPCEQHPDDQEAFHSFVRQYTILDAIRDIAAAWEAVPQSTIVKSFNEIFPKDEWDKLAGDINDFKGFNGDDLLQRPVPDNVNTHMGDVGGQVINQEFLSEIDESLQLLNLSKKDSKKIPKKKKSKTNLFLIFFKFG